MANMEGLPIDRDETVEMIVGLARESHVFEYGNVVFTVGKIEPLIHVYADDSGIGLLKAGRRFMHDVWDVTGYQCLLAPIKQERVKKFAISFGWVFSGFCHEGFDVYGIMRGAQ